MAKSKRKSTKSKVARKKLYSVKIVNDDGTVEKTEIYEGSDFFVKSFSIEKSTFVSSTYNMKGFEKEASNYYSEIEELLK